MSKYADLSSSLHTETRQRFVRVVEARPSRSLQSLEDGGVDRYAAIVSQPMGTDQHGSLRPIYDSRLFDPGAKQPETLERTTNAAGSVDTLVPRRRSRDEILTAAVDELFQFVVEASKEESGERSLSRVSAENNKPPKSDEGGSLQLVQEKDEKIRRARAPRQHFKPNWEDEETFDPKFVATEFTALHSDSQESTRLLTYATKDRDRSEVLVQLKHRDSAERDRQKSEFISATAAEENVTRLKEEAEEEEEEEEIKRTQAPRLHFKPNWEDEDISNPEPDYADDGSSCLSVGEKPDLERKIFRRHDKNNQTSEQELPSKSRPSEQFVAGEFSALDGDGHGEILAAIGERRLETNAIKIRSPTRTENNEDIDENANKFCNIERSAAEVTSGNSNPESDASDDVKITSSVAHKQASVISTDRDSSSGRSDMAPLSADVTVSALSNDSKAADEGKLTKEESGLVPVKPERSSSTNAGLSVAQRKQPSTNEAFKDDDGSSPVSSRFSGGWAMSYKSPTSTETEESTHLLTYSGDEKDKSRAEDRHDAELDRHNSEDISATAAEDNVTPQEEEEEIKRTRIPKQHFKLRWENEKMSNLQPELRNFVDDRPSSPLVGEQADSDHKILPQNETYHQRKEPSSTLEDSNKPSLDALPDFSFSDWHLSSGVREVTEKQSVAGLAVQTEVDYGAKTVRDRFERKKDTRSVNPQLEFDSSVADETGPATGRNVTMEASERLELSYSADNVCEVYLEPGADDVLGDVIAQKDEASPVLASKRQMILRPSAAKQKAAGEMDKRMPSAQLEVSRNRERSNEGDRSANNKLKTELVQQLMTKLGQTKPVEDNRSEKHGGSRTLLDNAQPAKSNQERREQRTGEAISVYDDDEEEIKVTRAPRQHFKPKWKDEELLNPQPERRGFVEYGPQLVGGGRDAEQTKTDPATENVRADGADNPHSEALSRGKVTDEQKITRDQSNPAVDERRDTRSRRLLQTRVQSGNVETKAPDDVINYPAITRSSLSETVSQVMSEKREGRKLIVAELRRLNNAADTERLSETATKIWKLVVGTDWTHTSTEGEPCRLMQGLVIRACYIGFVETYILLLLFSSGKGVVKIVLQMPSEA